MIDIQMLLGMKPLPTGQNGRRVTMMEPDELEDAAEPEDPKQRKYSDMRPAARQKLLIRYLRADGPATMRELAKTLGSPTGKMEGDLGKLRSEGLAEVRNFGNYWVWWAK